jgi:hypothetical protein
MNNNKSSNTSGLLGATVIILVRILPRQFKFGGSTESY